MERLLPCSSIPRQSPFTVDSARLNKLSAGSGTSLHSSLSARFPANSSMLGFRSGFLYIVGIKAGDLQPNQWPQCQVVWSDRFTVQSPLTFLQAAIASPCKACWPYTAFQVRATKITQNWLLRSTGRFHEEPDMTSCIIDCWWPWQQHTTTINYPVYATTIYDHKVTNPEGDPNKASGPSKISSSWTCSLPGFWERVLDLSGTTHRLNQHPTLIGCELALGTLSGPHPCPNRLEGLQLSLLVSRGMGKNASGAGKSKYANRFVGMSRKR